MSHRITFATARTMPRQPNAGRLARPPTHAPSFAVITRNHYNLTIKGLRRCHSH